MNPMPLLDLIAKHESESAAAKQGVSSGYAVVVWQAFKMYSPAKPITTMTVSEVLNWQQEAVAKTKQVYGSGYSAAGRYQVIRKTLQSLGVNGNTLFDKETQDVLTGGWVSYSHNLTLVSLFSHALVSTERGHAKALEEIKADIEQIKRNAGF